MLDKNTNQQIEITPKTEEQKRADLALANLGMRPYNREDEPIDDVGTIIVEKVTTDDLQTEKTLGYVMVDAETIVPSEVARQTLEAVGNNPLDEITETPNADSMKQFDMNDRKAS